MKRIIKIPLVANGDLESIIVESNNIFALKEKYNFKSFKQIEDLVRGYTIYPRFEIFVLNQDETEKYELPLEDIISGGNYQENYQNGQRRTLSFTLNNEDGRYTPSPNTIWVGQKFSLKIGMQIQETEDIIWFNKGIFVCSDINPSKTKEQKTVSISLKDKFSVFEGNSGTLTTSLDIEVGTDIESIIKDILLREIGNGSVVDPKPFVYHTSFKGKKTPQKISESAGSKWSSVILKLATFLSAEVFYNADGQLTFVPIVDIMQDSEKPVLFNFFENEGDFQTNGFNLQFENIVNKVVVIGANVNGRTYTAEAVNSNSKSPTNYKRIGYKTGDLINDSAITSDILAKERAEYELRKQSILKSTSSTTVYFNPMLSVNNLISITDDYYKLSRERFLLQTVSFGIDYSGIMSISSVNINELPFTY